MAILETTVKRFIGTSTDTKPYIGWFRPSDGVEVTAADLPAGSSFLEEDTGKVYRWTGRDWEYAESSEVIVLRSIHAVLSEILEAVRTPDL